MTTDRRQRRRRFLPFVIGAPVALCLWAAISVLVTLFQPAGRPVAVFAPGGPQAALAAVVAAGGSILEMRSGAVIAIAHDPGFVRRLYAEGALIVFRARGKLGCGLGTAFADRTTTPV
jgi:hypothetical protein